MLPPAWRGRGETAYREHLARRADADAAAEARRANRKATTMSVLGFDIDARVDRDLHRAQVASLAARLRGNQSLKDIYSGCKLAAFETLAGGEQGTSDFASLLRDAAEVVALERFAAATPAHRLLARETAFRDFRPSNVVPPPDLALLDLGERGELRAGTIDDTGETVVKVTKAALWRLTRRSVINDDSGSLASIAESAAQAAIDARETVFFSLLTSASGAGPTLADGVAYFATARGNLLSAAALNATSLAAAVGALRGMLSASGTLLSLGARFLLVPPASETTARTLARDLAVPGETPLGVIASGHLSTGFYVASDPAQRPGWVHGGVFRRPFIFESARDFDSDGVQFRLLTDFGVGPADPKAMVYTPAP